jgi:hypothetical protein
MHRYFGLSEADLLAKFNTTQFQVQSKEAFLKVADDVASRSQNLEDFQAAIKRQKQSKVAQLKQNLEDLALLVVARSPVGVLDSKNPRVMRLLCEPSLEGLADCFLVTRPAARDRSTSADAVRHRSRTTVLPTSQRSMHSVKQQPVLKLQYSGVQKKTARDRATISKPVRRSARLNQETSLET